MLEENQETVLFSTPARDANREIINLPPASRGTSGMRVTFPVRPSCARVLNFESNDGIPLPRPGM